MYCACKKSGDIIHRESRTFSKKELAKTWGKIRKEAAELNTIKKQDKVISIGELLDLFINNVDLWARDCPLSFIIFEIEFQPTPPISIKNTSRDYYF